jgi:hypothetical protein
METAGVVSLASAIKQPNKQNVVILETVLVP